MDLVLHLSAFNWSSAPQDLGAVLADVAGLADEAGFRGIAVADHLWQHPAMGGPEANCLEAYSTLAFLAAHSRTIGLFTLATGVHFRHPALLAKTVTTLDVLSRGRAWLGIGAGHFADECVGLGVLFPSLTTRYELLEDALEMCIRMWSGDRGDDRPFSGANFRAERVLNSPQALQRPHPPILIAGGGERRTLALVARYGDACSLRPGPDIPRKLDVLRRHCDLAGTDFERIERTCAFAFNIDDGGRATRELVDQLRWLAGLGVETVIGRVEGSDPRITIELLARHVISLARHLEAHR
jgi:alkanesulfonate monooxygenase SsuD/methylene tetrahydromethanopterin reductase-like flavin-dependent oxidoreductase (luciferase family)